MIVYCLLIVTLWLAITSLRLAFKYRKTGYTMQLLLSVLLSIFIYLYGAWLFLSVYTKYLFAILYIIIAVVSIKRRQHREVIKRHRVFTHIRIGLLAVLIILYFTGTTGRPAGVARLSLPFKHGTYYVFQGGKGLPTNLFHFAFRGAVYAMDIVKLNAAGNRARRIFSKRLGDYEIFGDTLYSPCSGRVVRVQSENPDNIPPNRQRGPTNTNQVLLATPTMYVFMGHLKHGCVFVHEGDSVTVGQPLGCCGNSGFSLEPHMHIQAQERTNSGLPWYQERPLLILFDNKYYDLFEEIKAAGR